MGKKIALVQCAARAASTAGVFFGQGPSSKVSTTAPSRGKSWLLKCSNRKRGPPVVSISTTRAIPRALGLSTGAGRRQAKEKEEEKPVRRPSRRELRPKPARPSRRP